MAATTAVPAGLVELRHLGRILKRRAHDILACFDWPGTGNGSTETLNGRLDYLLGSALASATSQLHRPIDV